MSAEVVRGGKRVRPSFNFSASDSFTSEAITAQLAESQRNILEDIAYLLREMNQSLRVLRCDNFTAIPRKLDRISANTAKPRKKS